jgi:hypothetical protein
MESLNKKKPIEKLPLPGERPIRKKKLKNSDFFDVKDNIKMKKK